MYMLSNDHKYVHVQINKIYSSEPKTSKLKLSKKITVSVRICHNEPVILIESSWSVDTYLLSTIYDSWHKPIGLEGMDPVGTSIILSSFSTTGAGRS